MARRVWLVPGAGGGAFEWVAWARVLRAYGFEVHCFEARPRDPLETTRFKDHRAQLAAALDDDGEFALIGASLGGLLAWSVLPQAGARALVLVNAVPPAPWHTQLSETELPSPVVDWSRTAGFHSTRRAIGATSYETIVDAAARWRDESGAVIAAARAGIALPSPTVPVLVMASREDDDVPFAASAAMARDIGADFHACVGATHLAPLLGIRAGEDAEAAARWLLARWAG